MTRLQAQQLLWAACHTYEDEQAAADVRTRQLVCQRYKPLDVAVLQVGCAACYAMQPWELGQHLHVSASSSAETFILAAFWDGCRVQLRHIAPLHMFTQHLSSGSC